VKAKLTNATKEMWRASVGEQLLLSRKVIKVQLIRGSRWFCCLPAAAAAARALNGVFWRRIRARTASARGSGKLLIISVRTNVSFVLIFIFTITPRLDVLKQRQPPREQRHFMKCNCMIYGYRKLPLSC
jgi:hypothetical protein